jgi:Tol biopolymer transport system component
MQFSRGFRPGGALAVLLAGVALVSLPAPGSAQYFGRNKVQYQDFSFEILPTDHFNFYFYPVESEAVEDVARMGERWYERYARSFQHEFEAKKPVIIYADHPDFQQTNTLSGSIGEGTGGVTESLKNRVIMPLTGSYWDTDHVLGHELVHAFQYNIAQSRRGGGLQGLNTLPLWLIEGMAEYLSVGRDDPLTGMWIRDAIRRDALPTIKQMTNESKYFPYRFGQALWAYIGGMYGDDAIIQIYRRSLRVGFEPAIRQVLGMPTDTLSVRWKEQVAKDYLPLMKGKTPPSETGTLLLGSSNGWGPMNIAPSISPDGRYVAAISQKDLFSADLFLADAHTGKIVRKLLSANTDPHIEALRYIDSSGTWSPDGRYFAFVVTADGNNQLVIVDAEKGDEQQRIGFDNIGAINNPAWSPDGSTIAFTGMVGGISDLYLYDLESGKTTRLTDDKYADLQPTWSPDGKTIAFTSDRGPQTDFDKLTYSRFQIALMDVGTKEVRVLPIFGNVKHINPQYSPDGRSLFFISDQDGFSDVYRLDFNTGDVHRITNIATGVSGHTYLSPAMTVAAKTGRMVFSVFDSLEFHVQGMDPDMGTVAQVPERPEDQPGRMLPPTEPDRFSRVASYLADPQTGLLPPNTFTLPADAKPYDASLSLDYVGQPSLGVGTDNFGNYIGGGASAYFSDMLGNRVLGVAIQAQGTFKDIGGQAFYANMSHRWNWGVGAGRIPYLLGYYNYGRDATGDFLGLYRYRIFQTSAQGQVAYPFTSTRRVEFSGGVTRYSYDIEVDKYYMNALGQVVDFQRQNLNDSTPPPLNMFQTSAALVGDNTFYGFTSPIRGGRYRLEVEQTWGTANFTTLIADWRRYYSPTKDLTLAARGLHFGRYGLSQAENNKDGFGLLRPLFLGYETLIRGYDYASFSSSECAAGATAQDNCPVFNRLFGQRLAVVNLEARVPLIGVEQYGIINFPFLPTELSVFADGGLAWDQDNPAKLEWSRTSPNRIPVFSTGVSARFNILGFMVLEVYYAYPWQRPQKGWLWGFNLAPGW